MKGSKIYSYKVFKREWTIDRDGEENGMVFKKYIYICFHNGKPFHYCDIGFNSLWDAQDHATLYLIRLEDSDPVYDSADEWDEEDE